MRYIILITGHYTPTQWILDVYMFVKHTSHGFLFYQLSKQTALRIDTRHEGLTFLFFFYMFFKSAVVKNADLMFKQSVWTSLIAASIASKHLKE